jgi:hypothetical protein
MIWRVCYADAPWATVVVRAPTREEAEDLGFEIGREYSWCPRESVTADRLPEDGPTERLIESWG